MKGVCAMEDFWLVVLVERGVRPDRQRVSISSRKSEREEQHRAQQITQKMDSSFRGTFWMTFILSTLPLLSCAMVCPRSCLCKFKGAVECTGFTITDIPQQLPLHTYLLQLNGTNMSVINEQSLANQDLLLRFSLTHSHLHTIHPRAFHIAPQLKSVKLSSNDLSTLPARVFSPLRMLEQLHLDGNQLEVLAPDMFEGLVGLLDLDLSRNKLTSPASDIFDGLTNLTFLNLGRNFIKKLPPTVFHSLTKLQLLFIYHNEIDVLEAGIFDKLVNLVELKIHHNHIASIAPQVFWSLRKLSTLTLSSNHLQAIPEKSFYNMPKLSKLTIYNNPLLSLPDELMGHMPEMSEFYLFGTNLTTVPGNLFANMSGLLRLNFHLNDKLRELPPDLFCCLPNLQKLSLKHNSIVHLHPQLFSKLPTLNILLLNDNKLQSLPETIFLGLGGIVSMDLRSNNLQTLPGDIFLSNTVLKTLMLSGNPWECTCSIRDIARWIRHNEHVVQDKEYVICHSPLYHALHTVGSLREEEFNICDLRRANNYFPLSDEDFHEPTQSLHVVSNHGQTTFMSPTTTASTTLGDDQEVTLGTTTSSAKPTTSQATTSLHSTVTTLPNETPYVSPAFYGMLVVEQGPEFVHHNFHNGWVYVWFLPSNTTTAGFLMFCQIVLVATGLLLILAAIYGMYRLNKAMLKDECAHNEE